MLINGQKSERRIFRKVRNSAFRRIPAAKRGDDKSSETAIPHRKQITFIFFPVFLLFTFYFLISGVNAQKIAVLTPEKNAESRKFAEKIEPFLSANFRVLDKSLSEAAFNSVAYKNPFNLSLEESKNIGAAIGCDYFLLIKAKNLRRFSLEKKEYFESFAAVYLVSSRSGRLIFWKLIKGESKTAEEAEKLLLNSAENPALEIVEKILEIEKAKINENTAPKLEELPEDDAPEAKNFRPPLPYKRFRPQYTEIANLYSVEATVDILLDVDENGKILRTEISRWAGFGLDESVIKTVMEMTWRPASRNGKNLPIRVLLRYNFTRAASPNS